MKRSCRINKVLSELWVLYKKQILQISAFYLYINFSLLGIFGIMILSIKYEMD